MFAICLLLGSLVCHALDLRLDSLPQGYLALKKRNDCPCHPLSRNQQMPLWPSTHTPTTVSTRLSHREQTPQTAPLAVRTSPAAHLTTGQIRPRQLPTSLRPSAARTASLSRSPSLSHTHSLSRSFSLSDTHAHTLSRALFSAALTARAKRASKALHGLESVVYRGTSLIRAVTPM